MLNMLSYLRLLDISENYFTSGGIGKVSDSMKGMEGITSVLVNDEIITANSGVQTRVQVRTGKQRSLDDKEMEVRAAMGSDNSGPSHKAEELLNDADVFLERRDGKQEATARAHDLPTVKPPLHSYNHFKWRKKKGQTLRISTRV